MNEAEEALLVCVIMAPWKTLGLLGWVQWKQLKKI
jgi:hypothetical protein